MAGRTGSSHETASAGARGRSILVGWVWIGLASGLLVAVVLGVRRAWLGQLIFDSEDYWWMTPVAQVVVLSPLAVGFVGLALGFARAAVGPLAIGAMAFVGALSVLVMFGALGTWGAIPLALGIGVTVSRWWRRDPTRAARMMIVSSLAMTVAVIGFGLRARAGGPRTRLEVRSPDPASPNVLLLILDTVRRDHLSLYGYRRATTPGLQRWAADAAVFDRAHAPAPWSLPSHGAMLTGRLGSELGGDWLTPVPGHPVTFAELLRQRGYRTGGFSANALYLSRESGLTDGFVHYRDYPITAKQIVIHAPLTRTSLGLDLREARSLRQFWAALWSVNLNVAKAAAGEVDRHAASVVDEFLGWEAGSGDRPWVAMLNFFDAHRPYWAPAELRETYGTRDSAVNRYDAAIRYLDREIDRLLGDLARRGVLDRTIVVITADHGELFGEHGLTGHGNALYLPLLRVPLIIRYPSRVPAVRIGDLVSLRDLPRTILELTGAAGDSGFAAGTGSLLGVIGGRAATPREPAIAELSRGINVSPKYKNARTWLQSATDADYHYVRNGLGEEELYHLPTDSLETINVAADASHAAARIRLKGFLDALTRPRG